MSNNYKNQDDDWTGLGNGKQPRYSNEELMQGEGEEMYGFSTARTKKVKDFDSQPQITFNDNLNRSLETDLQGFDPHMSITECFILVGKIAVPPILGSMMQIIV